MLVCMYCNSMATVDDSRRVPRLEWGRIVKARRMRHLGISQEELALRAHISPSLVAKIERGVHPITKMSLENIMGLISALEWTPRGFAQDAGIELPVLNEATKKEGYDTFVNVLIAGANPQGRREKVPAAFISPEKTSDDYRVVVASGGTLACPEVRKRVPPGQRVLVSVSTTPTAGVIGAYEIAGRCALIRAVDGAESTVLQAFEEGEPMIVVRCDGEWRDKTTGERLEPLGSSVVTFSNLLDL